MTTQPEQRRRGLSGRRRWWVVATVVAVLIGLIIVWRVLDGDDSASDAGGVPRDLASVDGSGSPLSTPSPSPGQTEPGLADVPSTTPKPVREPMGEVAEIDRGVTAEIVRLESVQGEASGAGERDAPAVRFTIEISNDTSSTLDLRAATITAYTGRDLDPAPDIGGPGVQLFPSSVAPGSSARGVYVFAIPPKRRDDVTVHVGYRAESPTVVFRGSVT